MNIFEVLEKDSILIILSFLSKRLCLTKFILLSKECNKYIEYVYNRTFYEQDYVEICKDCSYKMLLKFIENRKCILNKNEENKNILKYVIRNEYKIVLTHVEEKRKSFKWNYKKYELLRYSILNKKQQQQHSMISFFLEKVGKGLGVNIQTELMNIAISTKDDDIILQISKYLNIKLPSRYYSIKTLVQEYRYRDVVKKIMDENEKIKEDDIEEILDIMVKRKEQESITFILNNYNGEFLGETPLLRAMTLKLKDITKILLLTKKLDVKVCDNKPIILASENGWLENLKIIIQLGGDPSTQDNTPIVVASRNGHFDIVKYLMTQESVDPSDMNNYAYDEAIRSRYNKIAELLMKDKRVEETKQRLSTL